MLWRLLATITGLGVIGATWDIGSEPLLSPTTRQRVVAALLIAGFVFGCAVGGAVNSLRPHQAHLLVHTFLIPNAPRPLPRNAPPPVFWWLPGTR